MFTVCIPRTTVSLGLNFCTEFQKEQEHMGRPSLFVRGPVKIFWAIQAPRRVLENVCN